MAVEIRATPLANKIIEGLPRRSRRRGYRLSGAMLSHLCVAHLTGAMRVIVAFQSAEVAYVVLIGSHDDSRPPLDVYRQLYYLAGYEPPDQAGRDKPPCCDTQTGEPPVDAALLDNLLARMRRYRASDLHSAPRRRRGACPDLAMTPLARRPYDLRHAALSLWLNATADPAQVAARAGNSVSVLHDVYTHCISGRDEVVNRQIERALSATTQMHQRKASGAPHRRQPLIPVRYMSVNGPHPAARTAARRAPSASHWNAPDRVTAAQRM